MGKKLHSFGFILVFAFIPANFAETNNDLATQMDWFPTFISLTGSSFDQNRMIDGIDITNVLLGKGELTPISILMEMVPDATWKGI
jgi:arylsulfatase A-like enzyme